MPYNQIKDPVRVGARTESKGVPEFKNIRMVTKQTAWPQSQKLNLEEAKRVVTIPMAWERLGLPGNPGRCVASPFRPDRHPSFSIFCEGLMFKDHATGEAGDVIDFVRLALNLSTGDSIRWVIQEASGGNFRPIRSLSLIKVSESQYLRAQRVALNRKRVAFPGDMRSPTPVELEGIAHLRAVSLAAVREASNRKLLFTGTLRDGTVGSCVRSWIITDASRRCGQARRMDGRPWQSIGAKAKTLSGSQASWPVGLEDLKSPARKLVFIVEGGPDLLAAFHLAVSAGIPIERVCVVSMLGASQPIHNEAVNLLSDVPIWILPHGDLAGENAVGKWAQPLLARGREVNIFHVSRLGHSLADGTPVKDLNDLCRVPELAGRHDCLRKCRSLSSFFNLCSFDKGYYADVQNIR